MKVVILAGGLGTRLAEETGIVPKPLVEIGGRPILWHIMQIYAAQGFKDFVLALGYKGVAIKRFFLEYGQLEASLSIDMSRAAVTTHGISGCDWHVDLVDTGIDTQTGGRVRRLKEWLGNEPFLLTYGDGVSNVDLHALIAHHRKTGRLATITAVRPPARFGGLELSAEGTVTAFTEKPQIGEGWINGGFMVIEPEALDLLGSDEDMLERQLLEVLAERGQLAAYAHDGFWQCMDTLREKRILEDLWKGGSPPWKIW